MENIVYFDCQLEDSVANM